jgi:hypothetical protein
LARLSWRARSSRPLPPWRIYRGKIIILIRVNYFFCGIPPEKKCDPPLKKAEPQK